MVIPRLAIKEEMFTMTETTGDSKTTLLVLGQIKKKIHVWSTTYFKKNISKIIQIEGSQEEGSSGMNGKRER